jgi:hypothetical protein
MTPDGPASWEDVLAECETTAAHAEALLRSRGLDQVRPRPPQRSLSELTANLGRPSPEIMERARIIQRRHFELQIQLARSMRDIEHQSQLISDGGGVPPRVPVYIDRTA